MVWNQTHEVGGRSIVQRCQQKFNNTGDKESCREGIWCTKKHNSHCDKDKVEEKNIYIQRDRPTEEMKTIRTIRGDRQEAKLNPQPSTYY